MMRCKIADLIVDVPVAGDMLPRCREYLHEGTELSDIQIDENLYRYELWPSSTKSEIAYFESGLQFYGKLLKYHGLMLHASAIVLDGKAYLFSGPCGMGKSTHAKLWQQTFGSAAQIINDDKPPLRKIDGTWYAYGTPWCGKDGINQNRKAPVAGICFLQQDAENSIQRLNVKEATVKIILQTRRRFFDSRNTELMLKQVEELVCDIPVFLLKNRPESAAAQLSYEVMKQTAEDLGL